jgi:hypothetical protein
LEVFKVFDGDVALELGGTLFDATEGFVTWVFDVCEGEVCGLGIPMLFIEFF